MVAASDGDRAALEATTDSATHTNDLVHGMKSPWGIKMAGPPKNRYGADYPLAATQQRMTLPVDAMCVERAAFD